MMRKFILIASVIVTMTLSEGYSQNRNIRFNEKPWKEIVAMAKSENKLIFMDAFASWCGPCKWMAANMFTNDTVADYYNSTFICAHFDMEKGEGLELRKKYQIRAYPSLLFISPENEGLVHERVGAPQRVREYLDMGKVALNPDECLATYIKKYQSGTNTPQFIEGFLARLTDAYIPVDDVMKKYFDTQKESDLISRTNWNIIFRYVSEINDPIFEYLSKHQNEYAKLYSKDSVDKKIADVYGYALQKYSRMPKNAKNDSAYQAVKDQILASGFTDADRLFFNSDLQRYQAEGNIESYVRLAYEGIDKYYSGDYAMLNNAAWSISSLSTDPKYLEKAAEWSKKSVSLKSEASNNDTYAAILLKLGKNTEAIKYEKAAIEIAKKLNQPAERYEEALKKMEEAK